jgi:hypothetical protein
MGFSQDPLELNRKAVANGQISTPQNDSYITKFQEQIKSNSEVLRVPNSELKVGDGVVIPRSNGGMSKAVISAANKDGTITVSWMGEDGKMFQKTLNPSSLKAVDPLEIVPADPLELNRKAVASGQKSNPRNDQFILDYQAGLKKNDLLGPVPGSNYQIGDGVMIPRSNGGTSKAIISGVNGKNEVVVTWMDEQGNLMRKNLNTSDLKLVEPIEKKSKISGVVNKLKEKWAETKKKNWFSLKPEEEPISAGLKPQEKVVQEKGVQQPPKKQDALSHGFQPSSPKVVENFDRYSEDLMQKKGYYTGGTAFAQWGEGADLPDQGWKLHVSLAPEHASEIADAVLPQLRKMNVTHKVAHSLGDFSRWEGTQAGKFITIYPHNEQEARQLSKIFSEVLEKKGFKSSDFIPIKGEEDCGTGLFGRYGRFTSGDLRDAAGNVIPESDGMLLSPEGRLYEDARGAARPSWVAPLNSK